MKINIEKDVKCLHHQESDNNMLEPISLGKTFKKAGHYIFILGWVALLGKVIIELLAYLHCEQIEAQLRNSKMQALVKVR